MIKREWIDDIEMDDEGLGDVIMDQNYLASAPRPGTSLSKPLTAAQGGGGALGWHSGGGAAVQAHHVSPTSFFSLHRDGVKHVVLIPGALAVRQRQP